MKLDHEQKKTHGIACKKHKTDKNRGDKYPRQISEKQVFILALYN